MKILVVYASHYGATAGIAERIAATLSSLDMEAVATPASHAPAPEEFDATVIGSAAYFFHWLRPAATYVRQNRGVLATRPVWLFSSGPLGPVLHDAAGQKEQEKLIPREIEEFSRSIYPREHRIFAGAMEPSKMGLFHRLLRKLPFNKNDSVFPAGDFRDWNEIDSWAKEIGAAMQAMPDAIA